MIKFTVIKNADITELGFSVRTYNVLRRAEINTVQDIVDNYDNLKYIRYLGWKNYNEVVEKIKPYVKTN